jgi:hypothetical protein
MNRFEQLMSHVESLKDDLSKFYEGGNKAAGTRVRVKMQELKNLAQDIRKEVTEKKNTKA